MTTIGTKPTSMSGDYYTEMRSGTGWLFFAGTVLGIAGLMRIVDSIWAFSYHGSLPDNLKDGVLGSNLSHYAWLWLGVGIVLFVSSFAVIAQSQVARWVGIVAAGIGAISAMFWMPYYPVWSLVYVGLGVLTMYALIAHGGREAA
ncbi:MAG TPA: hypothetical protein VFH45_04835 [Acidimicrobiales bacterium]|nr:hypothetical protein [Acidimicrobiales bacterium]